MLCCTGALLSYSTSTWSCNIRQFCLHLCTLSLSTRIRVKDPDFGTLEGTYDLWFKLALKLTTIRNFLPMFSLTHVVPVLGKLPYVLVVHTCVHCSILKSFMCKSYAWGWLCTSVLHVCMHWHVCWNNQHSRYLKTTSRKGPIHSISHSQIPLVHYLWKMAGRVY
jgi:hypothetical protein